jgi:hypothetical protein
MAALSGILWRAEGLPQRFLLWLGDGLISNR